MKLNQSKIYELISFDKDMSLNNIIIGTDEAGRGPGAGPVYAAAVYFPYFDEQLAKKLELLNDSKKLSKKHREELAYIIKENTIWAINSISSAEIDKINILEASLKAMKQSCEEVLKKIENPINPKVLVDGKIKIRNFDMDQITIIKGDSKSASIAAASILAKVERDCFMTALSEKHPEYHWNKNKGYLTKVHLEAIKEFGITKWHRKSFLKNYI